MRIALVIPTMSSGGAERVISIMANYWVNKGNEITLITIDSQKNDFYKLDPRINRIGFNLMYESNTIWSAIKSNIVRINQLRSVIKKQNPKVVISFIDVLNTTTLLALLGININVVISERNDPRQYSIGRIRSWLKNWLYPKARVVVVQSESVRKWMETIVSKDRLYVIPNPVQPVKDTELNATYEIQSPYMVAMGRLVPQKGFDYLLEAFSRIVNLNYNNWQLVIIGEGAQKNYLESYAYELDIKSHVVFLGRIQEPQSVLKNAELFVLSSRYEGFPNALLEAMSCGLPVVSFDCPSGPKDIIRNGIDGVLVPPGDVSALADAIIHMIDDESGRERMGAQAKQVTERYSIERVMGLWDSLLSEVTN